MPWELTGNSITANGGFLGTTDAQPLSIRTNNAERMRLTPTGELLIGTTSPVTGTRLRVAGGGATINNVAIGTDAPPGIDYPEQDRTIGVTGTSHTLRLQSPNALALHTGPSGTTTEENQRLTVNTAGNVGIGTTAPAHKLDVAGTINATSINAGTIDATDIRTNGSSLVSSQWSNVTDGISYGIGNVGLGAVNPSYKLNVDGAMNATSINAGTIDATDVRTNGSSLVSSQWTSATGGGISYAAGNVGIGTISAAYKLNVDGAMNATFVNAASVNAGTIDATDVRKSGSSLVSSQWSNVASGISYGVGNVGIGKTAEAIYRLDVAGAINATDVRTNGSSLVSSQWSSAPGGISYGGNVAIGTAPSAGAKLSVSGGGATINNIAIGTDVAGIPGINYPNEAETIGVATTTATLRLQSPNGLTFHTGAAGGTPVDNQRVTITSGGNVGIGTTTPSVKLDVAGPVNATDVRANGSSLVSSQWSSVAGGISYATGNVGIGTPVPENAEGWSKVLDLSGGAHTKLSVRTNNIDSRVLAHDVGFWGAPPGMLIGTRTAHPLSFGTGGSSKMTIASSGNVGIGTTAPENAEGWERALDVFGNAHAKLSIRNAAIDARVMAHDAWWGAPAGMLIGTHTNHSLSFGTNRSTRMTVDTNGNVGIGTLGPTHRFHVVAPNAVGLFESSGGEAFLRLSTNEGLNNRVEITNRPGGRLSLWTAGAGDVFNITRGGNVGVGTITPGARLEVNGTLRVTGPIQKLGGGFRIPHPLDTNNKDLQHSFVESPDMKNVYDGVQQLNADGSAWIELPEWFDALNQNFRYQLTALGGSAPELYVAEEIIDNKFRIAGGKEGMKVSWQVTGVRKDEWAKANRIEVEIEKHKVDCTPPNGDFDLRADGAGMDLSSYNADLHLNHRSQEGARTVHLYNWANHSSRDSKENITDFTTREATQALESLHPVSFTWRDDEEKTPRIGFIAEDAPQIAKTTDETGIIPMPILTILSKVVQEQQRAVSAMHRQLDLPGAIAERNSDPIVPGWQRALSYCPAMLRRWFSRVIRP